MPRKRAPAAEAATPDTQSALDPESTLDLESTLDPELLFAGVASARGLVLAVSGGPDSTALMLLMARWPARPPALVAIVDHRLRPESAAEADLAAANAERVGLPWRILRAPERPEGGNLQDWARHARYACLAKAAEEAGFDTIVTAHHQEDQAETFMLRLARGSGVYGLAAMAEETVIGDLRLVRPLLNLRRAQLFDFVAASGLPTVSDPSNVDQRFDRARLRAFMPALAGYGLTAARLAGTAARVRRAATALDHYACDLLKRRFAADHFGVVAGPASALGEVPEEVGLRSLALILKAVGGAEYTPPLDRLERLFGALLTSERRDLKRTLHGVALTLSGGRLLAQREWGREGLGEMPAPPDSTIVWDGRFRVEVPGLAPPLVLAPLGLARGRIEAQGADRSVLRALPGLYRDGRLIAAPEGVAVRDTDNPPSPLAIECIVGRRLGLPDLVVKAF
jgi:tRNA(Ile)-lysidine synthase